MKIYYTPTGSGAIDYWYTQQKGFGGIHGTIPIEICRQGVKAIREYAEQKVREEIERREKENAPFAAFCDNPDTPVETLHEGVLLRGKIIRAGPGFITVRLEEPAERIGEASINYGMASAMSGHFIFSNHNPPTFSQDALTSAKRLLIQIYKENAHGYNARALADELNKEPNPRWH